MVLGFGDPTKGMTRIWGHFVILVGCECVIIRPQIMLKRMKILVIEIVNMIFFPFRLYVVFSYVEVQNCKHHNKKTQKKNSHMKNISNWLGATQSLANAKSVERASQTCLCVCAQPIH